MPIDLLTSPHWKAEHLGLPMPDSPHAVSAALPLWEHNIRYEEGDAEVVNVLQAAYPRFCLHPYVRRLCHDIFGAENSGLIFPSSAAAQRAVDHVVWRALRQHDSTNPSVQFGFPYVDTLKMQQRFAPADVQFYPVGNRDDLKQLTELLNTQKIAAVFCESTTNPLLTSLDLQALRQLADEHEFLLVIDDTLAACINHDVLPFADVVVTSLTKYFSGYGDVLAGSVTLNPASRHADWLRTGLAEHFEELLIDADVEILESNSRDVRARVEIMNRNANQLARWLTEQPQVDAVYHPSLDVQRFDWMNEHSIDHNGGLLSVVLKNAAVATPMMFDHLEICKGPNLGTNFTLCCPYTILAHFTELDFVEQCGVSRWLLRISVGTEPIEELQTRFQRALRSAQEKFHPT